jgi:hypothetical protein
MAEVFESILAPLITNLKNGFGVGDVSNIIPDVNLNEIEDPKEKEAIGNFLNWLQTSIEAVNSELSEKYGQLSAHEYGNYYSIKQSKLLKEIRIRGRILSRKLKTYENIKNKLKVSQHSYTIAQSRFENAKSNYEKAKIKCKETKDAFEKIVTIFNEPKEIDPSIMNIIHKYDPRRREEKTKETLIDIYEEKGRPLFSFEVIEEYTKQENVDWKTAKGIVGSYLAYVGKTMFVRETIEKGVIEEVTLRGIVKEAIEKGLITPHLWAGFGFYSRMLYLPRDEDLITK